MLPLGTVPRRDLLTVLAKLIGEGLRDAFDPRRVL